MHESIIPTCKNYQNTVINQVLFMVGMAGFEPTTTTPPVWCATRLRYIPKELVYPKPMLKKLVLIAWVPLFLSLIYPVLFGRYVEIIQLIALLTILVHLIEFFVFYKTVSKHGLLEGFVMTLIFGYVYIRELRK